MDIDTRKNITGATTCGKNGPTQGILFLSPLQWYRRDRPWQVCGTAIKFEATKNIITQSLLAKN
jgi:hypothetical protein